MKKITILLPLLLTILVPATSYGMQHLRKFFKPATAAIGNYLYGLKTYERPKFDEHGKPVFGKDGKQIFERLHTGYDCHEPLSSYEQTQAQDVTNHAKMVGIEKTQLTVESMRDEDQPYTPAYTRKDQELVYSLPYLPGYPQSTAGFLQLVHHACRRNNINSTNVEFRLISMKYFDSDQNITPLRDMIKAFEDYGDKTKQLTQQHNVSVPTEPKYTLENFKEKISEKGNSNVCVFHMYGPHSEDSVRHSFAASSRPAVFLAHTIDRMLDRRALVECVKRDSITTDRYCMLGGWHQGNIEKSLKTNNWSLVQQTGISTSQALSENDKNTSLVSRIVRTIFGEPSKQSTMVNVAEHFKALPERGATTNPAFTPNSDSSKRMITITD